MIFKYFVFFGDSKKEYLVPSILTSMPILIQSYNMNKKAKFILGE